MPEFTTAYLDNGQYVEVPEGYLTNWRSEVENGNTVHGLAQWYAFDPDSDEPLDAVEILGEPEDQVRCDHHAAQTIRATNESQTRGFDSSLPHASVWICSSRPCLIDAAAWIERSTGEAVRFTADKGHTWYGLSLPFI